MKKIAFLILFIFLSFIAVPTIVTCIDEDVDVSFAFTANEEENSAKNLICFEYIKEDNSSNQASIHFLREQKKTSTSYDDDYHQVYLDVLSPPPKQV